MSILTDPWVGENRPWSVYRLAQVESWLTDRWAVVCRLPQNFGIQLSLSWAGHCTQHPDSFQFVSWIKRDQCFFELFHKNVNSIFMVICKNDLLLSNIWNKLKTKGYLFNLMNVGVERIYCYSNECYNILISFVRMKCFICHTEVKRWTR